MPTFSRRTLLTGGAAGLAGWLAPSTAEACPRVTPEYFEVVHRDIALTGLEPAHHGLTMVQLSDLHFGRALPELRIRNAIRAVNALKPDLVVLTGDFLTYKIDKAALVPELLAGLRIPSVAVLGNHDHWSHPVALRRGLEKLDIPVLQNENTTLWLKGAPFTVVGIDDSTTKNDDVHQAFQGAHKGSRLVLTHTPSAAKKLPEDADLLCLSGHTHGGQWDVPKLTEGFFKKMGQPWYRGYYRVRGNQLYVNRGLGYGKGTRLPRLNSDPELSLLKLRLTPPR
jgi:predicted MPP superfamily phosphohydrolase